MEGWSVGFWFSFGEVLDVVVVESRGVQLEKSLTMLA